MSIRAVRQADRGTPNEKQRNPPMEYIFVGLHISPLESKTTFHYNVGRFYRGRGPLPHWPCDRGIWFEDYPSFLPSINPRLKKPYYRVAARANGQRTTSLSPRSFRFSPEHSDGTTRQFSLAPLKTGLPLIQPVQVQRLLAPGIGQSEFNNIGAALEVRGIRTGIMQ